MNYFNLILPACCACFFNACANVFWKFEFSKNTFIFSGLESIIKVFFSINIIIGIIFYICSMLLFFYMLSNFKLSVIVPLTSLTYIFNLIAAYLIFHEKVSFLHLIGTLIIIIGIIILFQAPIIIEKNN